MSTTKIKKEHDNIINVILLCHHQGNYGLEYLVGNEILLETQINYIRQAIPQAHICVTVGHNAYEIYDKTKRLDISCVYSSQHQNWPASVFAALLSCHEAPTYIIDTNTIFTPQAINDQLVNLSESKLIINNMGDKRGLGVTMNGNMATHLCYSQKQKWGKIIFLAANHMASYIRILNKQESVVLWHETLNELFDVAPVSVASHPTYNFKELP